MYVLPVPDDLLRAPAPAEDVLLAGAGPVVLPAGGAELPELAGGGGAAAAGVGGVTQTVGGGVQSVPSQACSTGQSGGVG